MNDQEMEIKIPTICGIKILLQPIFKKLDEIESKLNAQKLNQDSPKYFRNNDLKKFSIYPTIPSSNIERLVLFHIQN
ncbi:hypothetical protein [Winogradskyella sp.]|uniref:hypothetical protein n=1 Tax=Winogradskyella sp. TaxID=1883156 RepID=UPI0035160A77